MKKLLTLLFILVSLTSFAVEYAKPHIVTTRPPAGAKVLLHFNNDLNNLATNREWATQYGSLMSVEPDAAKYGSGGLEYRWSHSAVTELSATASDVADIASIGTGDFMYQTWYRVSEIAEATAPNAHAAVRLYFYKNSSDYMNYSLNVRMIVGDHSHYDLMVQASTYPFGGISDYTINGLNVGDWHHVALVRRSGVLYTFFDGNLVQTATIAASAFDLTGLTRLYDYSHTTTTGVLATTQIDDSMITTDVYTGNFTPPAELGDLAAPKITYGYERYINQFKDVYNNNVPGIVIPMELDGGSTIKTVGSFTYDGIYYRDNINVSATESSKKYNKYGLHLPANLSSDSMLLFKNPPYITSPTFTVGWWMRIDEIASVTSTLNDGFNFYLRNANGLDNIRVGLVYYPDSSDLTKLDVCMGVRYRNGATNSGFNTATTTLNVGDWNHFTVMRFTSGARSYIFFYVNGSRIGWVADTPATSGSLSFAQHMWMGWFGFTTPLEPYTTVRLSVDELYYAAGQLYSTATFTPPGKLNYTRYGSLTHKNE